MGQVIDWIMARLLLRRWGSARCGACATCVICDAGPEVQHSPGCPGRRPERKVEGWFDAG